MTTELRLAKIQIQEQEALIEKLGDILSCTAIALRGPVPAFMQWGWSDLPEFAEAAVASRKAAQIENEALKARLAHSGVELRQAVAAERMRAALAAQAVPQQPALDLAELITGMSVSVDVSTSDADIGNRYFGTVVEVMECAVDKHGLTLLVGDVEPNFRQPAPVAPVLEPLKPVFVDGWYLPADALNEPMRATLAALVAHSKRARWTNATVRNDSKETTYETDWIKHLVPVGSVEVDVAIEAAHGITGAKT